MIDGVDCKNENKPRKPQGPGNPPPVTGTHALITQEKPKRSPEKTRTTQKNDAWVEDPVPAVQKATVTVKPAIGQRGGEKNDYSLTYVDR